MSKSKTSRRDFLMTVSAATAGGFVLPPLGNRTFSVLSRDMNSKNMNTPKLESVIPWTQHPKAAPKTMRDGDTLIIAANGTRTVAGGWQIRYSGIQPGTTFRIDVPCTVRDIQFVRESLDCYAIWGDVPSDKGYNNSVDNEMLILHENVNGSCRFSRIITAPPDAKVLVIQYVFRWSTRGEVKFGMPSIAEAPQPEIKRVRLAVVTGSVASNKKQRKTIADNVWFYSGIAKEAAKTKPDMIVLPECALNDRAPGHAIDNALPLDCEEVKVFRTIARETNTHILVTLYERNGDAIHNSAAIVGKEGVIGVYRKVHLATHGETNSGLTPGDSFPVIETQVARFGCNICMDSSAAESSRMVALNGADVLLIPIMGDHRADRFDRGNPVFDEDRWKSIMRTHALDNQIVLAVARNSVIGSTIINTRGDIVAWNDGSQEFIVADVDIDPIYRMWNGIRQRDVIWFERRPRLYSAFTSDTNDALGNLMGV